MAVDWAIAKDKFVGKQPTAAGSNLFNMYRIENGSMCVLS